MIPQLNQQALDEIVEQIVKVLHPERIILFGSWARGEAGPDSDVDILVVADVADPKGFRSVEAREAIGSIPFSLDLLVITPEEWDRWHTFPNTVMGQAAKYGRLLHERRATETVVS